MRDREKSQICAPGRPAAIAAISGLSDLRIAAEVADVVRLSARATGIGIIALAFPGRLCVLVLDPFPPIGQLVAGLGPRHGIPAPGRAR